MTYHKVLKFTIASTIALSASLGAAAAETVTLRYNQWFPSGHWSQANGLYPYFEEIERVTEGRVVVEPSAAPLAPPTRNYQAVVDGIADMAWGPHGYTPGTFPLTEMVELPFITEDAGVSSAVYWNVWEQFFEPTGMQNDVVTLAMHVTAGGNIHMTEESVTSLGDLKGKRLRVPTPVVGRVLEQVGAVPVSGSLAELREMLSRGVVDGTAISDELVVGFRVDDEIKSITRVPGGLYSNSAFLIVSADKWAEISETDQKAIMAISGEVLSQTMGALWHENDVQARKMFKERLGDNYIEASAAFVSELEAAFSGELDAWKATAAEQGVDAEAVISFYRSAISGSGS
jgi:TRAP-type C4-dicarboxylate transport system substrate-binding protein